MKRYQCCRTSDGRYETEIEEEIDRKEMGMNNFGINSFNIFMVVWFSLIFGLIVSEAVKGALHG